MPRTSAAKLSLSSAMANPTLLTQAFNIAHVLGLCREVFATAGPCYIDILPDEVLEEIFYLISRHCRDAPAIYHKSNSHHAWFFFSHVSRRWRAIAITSPRLWTTIQMSGLEDIEVARALLERSIPMEIDVQIVGPRPFTTECDDTLAQLLVPHMARIGGLTVKECRAGGLKSIFDSLKSVAPKLHRLDVTCHTPQVFINTVMLENPTPLLRKLVVRNNAISWTSLMYSDLTTIDLRWFPVEGQFGTVDDLMLMLSRNTGLKELCLDFPDGLVSRADHSADTLNVRLPRLEQLVIKSCFRDVSQIISHIAFPPATHVAIHFTSNDITAVPPAPFDSQSMQALIANLHDVTLSFTTEYEPDVDASAIKVSMCAKPAGGALPSQYELTWHWHTAVGEKGLGGHLNFALLDFPRVERVAIHCEDVALMNSEWLGILDRLPISKHVAGFNGPRIREEAHC